MNFIQLDFRVSSEEQSEIITAYLEETGFIGSEIQDNLLSLCYQEDAFPFEEIQALCEQHQLTFEQKTIAQQNWNQVWESGFQPITIGNDIIVRASFHPPAPNFTWELIITPKMSFGTGHHATTQMMLKAILQEDCSEKRVLDYGCGTGVLAILAAKKGATYVLGIDIDDWCIENSEENAALNQTACSFALGNIDSLHESFDLILANINLNILKENMAAIEQRMNPGGVLLLSGILESDLNSILESCNAQQLRYVSKEICAGWMCLKVIKEASPLA
ncbi:MAG: 50S ribosomal protein L11 methyltransferase [Chitinophagaceae bacterium]|nr:50S ribosomal protein L11 methyltransferase [Chitinophagaceae bacterium]